MSVAADSFNAVGGGDSSFGGMGVRSLDAGLDGTLEPPRRPPLPLGLSPKSR